MLKRFTLRSIAVMSYIFLGAFALFAFFMDYLSIDNEAIKIAGDVFMVVCLAWFVPAVVIWVRDTDEMTREMERWVGKVTLNIVECALLLILAAIFVGGWDVSARDVCILVLSVLLLSYGIIMLAKLGRKDAYLED